MCPLYGVQLVIHKSTFAELRRYRRRVAESGLAYCEDKTNPDRRKLYLITAVVL